MKRSQKMISQHRARLRSTQSGFTLVEIMIVVMIIGVLLNIALPNLIQARNQSQAKACVSNLKRILGAKEQYALENRVDGASTTTVTWTNIQPYIRGNQPICPTNYPGQYTYSIGSMVQNPTCPYGGPAGYPTLAHVLP